MGVSRMCAERLVQSTTDARTVLHLKASGDAVQKLLPAGWVSAPGSGPLEDANAVLIFVEGIAAEDADGKPVPPLGKLAILAFPAKNEQTGDAGLMVVAGFASHPQGAPGAYGVYVFATLAMEKSSRSKGPGPTMVEEIWDVSTGAGDQLRFVMSYERGIGTRAHIEPRIYAAENPEFYRIYKADQVSEVVHSAADEAKRAEKVELSASGPLLSKVFDGDEQLVAVTSIPAYYRQVFLPEQDGPERS